MSSAKGWDELWVGVKCQSNLEIAGSPRNVFRCSLNRSLVEVGLWMGKGARAYQTQPNHKCHRDDHWE